MRRTRNRPAARHALRVQGPGLPRLAVACPPVVSADLAVRLALLLRGLLAAPDPEFVAAARWAFEALDAVESADVDPRACSVLVVRGRRTVAAFRVADAVTGGQGT